MKFYVFSLLIIAVLFSCASTDQLSDDALLTLVQHRTFNYFWDGAEPNSGLARERFHVDDVYPDNDKHVVTSGGSGFGVMAILVGIERGFITRDEGVARFEKILGFLETADRFYDAFSETENWFPQKYLAIDQGPIVVMIENYRSALLWDLFMSCLEVQDGLHELGFKY